MTSEQRIKQMRHRLFAQNLKNIGISEKDMTATKKVIKQLKDHFCPKYCEDGRYCPMNNLDSSSPCNFCLAETFEVLTDYLEVQLTGGDS